MNDEHLDDEENVTIIRDRFSKDELALADKVADEILKNRKRIRTTLALLLLVFILLTFFVSYAGFSIFQANRGSSENIIQSGSILFSYNEGSNSINIVGALPTADEVGKQLMEDGEFFEFSVSAEVNSKIQNKVIYEISLTPNQNTLDSKYIRVYLVENNKDVLINSKYVNYYNDLPDSSIRNNSKVLLKREVSTSLKSTYVFRMWVSNDYEVDDVMRVFSCFVNVDAY